MIAARTRMAMIAGFVFLYLPIVVVVVLSFNDSRLVNVWGGFSFRWYGELLRDERMLAAAVLSLAIAALAATLATLLGGLAGFALARLGRFRTRGLLATVLAALLVMPEIVIGVTMLLLFVALDRLTGWPAERGLLVVAISHATIAIAFVAAIVQARLADQDPACEEAAADLGARPWTIVATVTVPMAAPALVAGWLLAFTLSLDDVVVASFVAGPGSTTLPMLVFSSVRMGLSPEVNALATLLLAGVAAALLLVTRVLHRESLKSVASDPGKLPIVNVKDRWSRPS
jgi:putrescine transport system permease protein